MPSADQARGVTPYRRLGELAALLALDLPFLFVTLGMPLLDPDEGLYAAIAQEMLSRRTTGSSPT